MMPYLSDNEREQHETLKSSFVDYYNRVLVPLLQQKENFRLRCVKRFWTMVLIASVIVPLLIVLGYWTHVHYHVEIDVMFNIGLGLCALIVFVLRGPFAKYRHQIKNDVMGEFIKFFDGFSYCQGKKMDSLLMEKSLIFPKFDTYEADDCFFGTYKNVPLNVYEQKLIEVRQNSKGQRYSVTVFQGIAIEMEMNKNFSGQTIVLKDAGFLNKLKHFSHLERVTLEDVVFEKQFEVYSTNQVEARYLLTTAFMERILKLKNLYAGKKIEISFYNNKILLAIDTGEDMFEACSFFKSNLNQTRFEKVFEEFWTLFSIINILKLNQNIGM